MANKSPPFTPTWTLKSSSEKRLVFALCLAPFFWLVWQALTDGLGANPIEAATRFLGDWALRFLLITLAVTPITRLFSVSKIMRFRRMFGLFAFTYAAFHLSSYIVLDQFFHWMAIWEDITKRWYITIGMATFLTLVPLAVTSTNAMLRRLGAKRWKTLHKLVYGASVGAVVHFFLMVKADFSEPIIYAAILALLLGYRLFAAIRRQARA
jgi:methionine sulfoxide reductase heme-binding subunit